MKKFTTAVAVTLMGASLAMAAPQQGGGWEGHGHGKFGHEQKLFKQLNLTDAQKAQIKEIKKASFQANKSFFETSRATKEQFFAAKKANDTAKLDSLKPAMEAQRAQRKEIRTAEDAKIATVLTAEQNT